MRAPALPRRLLIVLSLTLAFDTSPAAQLSLTSNAWLQKLDPVLQLRAVLSSGRSRIVVRSPDAASLAALSQLIQWTGGTLGRPLPIIVGRAADVPNISLPTLAASSLSLHLSIDRTVAGAMERTGATVGATAIRQELGYDGAGVGVAIVDSGVAPGHDDLKDPATGAQRVDRFVDLVNGGAAAYDDYGHGTHVAGIVAGNGFDSSGRRSGIAPGAHLVAIKALDGSGRGRMSDVIAALDFAVANQADLNIRVVNLSIAAPVYESYDADPLTVAAERAVRAGIVVVASAGNNGRNQQGQDQYGGVTAPGNAPWVLTVGASSHMGTIDRSDDTIAAFSSRGPSAVDRAAKPDLVAPGVGIESLSNPDSAFYTTEAAYLLRGTVDSPPLPYLSLSGTSMAAPVVAGTVALMLQANPSLTPNEVKAILQYTAEASPAYDALTQGAGFLNAHGAVSLARYLAAPSTLPYPDATGWSRSVIWGTHLTVGGQLTPDANAWSVATHWGDETTASGGAIVWGVICTASTCDQPSAWSAWGVASGGQNVVWGSSCGGADCAGDAWTPPGGTEDDTAVWSTTSVDDGDIVVWGTSCTDPSCQPVIWGAP
jgi:serine protease AprX